MAIEDKIADELFLIFLDAFNKAVENLNKILTQNQDQDLDAMERARDSLTRLKSELPSAQITDRTLLIISVKDITTQAAATLNTALTEQKSDTGTSELTPKSEKTLNNWPSHFAVALGNLQNFSKRFLDQTANLISLKNLQNTVVREIFQTSTDTPITFCCLVSSTGLRLEFNHKDIGTLQAFESFFQVCFKGCNNQCHSTKIMRGRKGFRAWRTNTLDKTSTFLWMFSPHFSKQDGNLKSFYTTIFQLLYPASKSSTEHLSPAHNYTIPVDGKSFWFFLNTKTDISTALECCIFLLYFSYSKSPAQYQSENFTLTIDKCWIDEKPAPPEKLTPGFPPAKRSATFFQRSVVSSTQQAPTPSATPRVPYYGSTGLTKSLRYAGKNDTGNTKFQSLHKR